MPLIIPKTLPAFSTLEDENVFVMHEERAHAQEIRPLKILVLNLMPTKIVTETQLARLLANSPLQVEITFIKTETYKSTNVSYKHLDAFYRTFTQIQDEYFDGLIITGAPVENMEFEEVAYWDEFCSILEYAKKHVYSTLYVCWGAQAGLYYHYNINKRRLEKKVSGIYKHFVSKTTNPLIRGFDEEFFAPHSRYTDICVEQIDPTQLEVLATSKEAGVYLIASKDGRNIFVTGHPEYDKETLNNEYKRDIAKSLDVAIPVNYYIDNNPDNEIINRWKSHATLLYTNWLNYFVYQDTPYDLTTLKEND